MVPDDEVHNPTCSHRSRMHRWSLQLFRHYLAKPAILIWMRSFRDGAKSIVLEMADAGSLTFSATRPFARMEIVQRSCDDPIPHHVIFACLMQGALTRNLRCSWRCIDLHCHCDNTETCTAYHVCALVPCMGYRCISTYVVCETSNGWRLWSTTV